ncbi:MAG: response regulator, partial [Sphingobacteriales bacterium]
MFQKILLAEDFDTYNIAISGAIEQLRMPRPDHAAYCDEALLRIKLGIAN